MDGDGQVLALNLRFPGQYYDQESGLHYNYFRDYDAKLGRYAQSDPIGLAGGINTYLYANGNPLYYVDPYGLLGFTWHGNWGGPVALMAKTTVTQLIQIDRVLDGGKVITSRAKEMKDLFRQ